MVIWFCVEVWVRVMVFNVTFNIISVIYRGGQFYCVMSYVDHMSRFKEEFKKVHYVSKYYC